METDPDFTISKKRKRAIYAKKLLEGEEVEVRLLDAGLKGSWHRGVVVKRGKCKRWVKYSEILADDNNSNLVELIPVSAAVDGMLCKVQKHQRGRIRPFLRPGDCGSLELTYGTCVDCLLDDAWWEGVIFDHNEGSLQRMVFFPDQGDLHLIEVGQMRYTYDWDEILGDWQRRGTWTFLKLLSKLEKRQPFPVSIREIWYDVSCSDTYHRKVREWVFGSWSTWHHIVNVVIKEALSVSLGRTDNATDAALITCPPNNPRSDVGNNDLVGSLLGSGYANIDDAQLHIDKVGDDMTEEVLANDLISELCPAIFDREHPEDSKNMHGDYFENPTRGSDCVEIPTTGPKALSCHNQIVEQAFQHLVAERQDSPTRGSDCIEIPTGGTEALSGCCGHNQVLEQAFLHLVAERQGSSVPKYFNGSACVHDNAKKYLLSEGWQIKKLQDDVEYFVSPTGERYDSLLATCEAYSKLENHNEASTSPRDNNNSQTSMRYAESKGKRKKVENSGDEPLGTSEDLGVWQPMAIEAEYCHEMLVAYARYYENGKSQMKRSEGNANLDLDNARLKVKKHLVALGWKIFKKEEPFGFSKRVRFQYLSPHEEKFFSLRKVVDHLIDTGEHQSMSYAGASQDTHRSTRLCTSYMPEKEASYAEEHVTKSNYQSILDYINFMETKKDKCGGAPHGEMKVKVEKAKRNLQQLGWKIFYVPKKGRQELRYSSPNRKCFISLLSACRDILKQIDSSRIEVTAVKVTAMEKGGPVPLDHTLKPRNKFCTSLNDCKLHESEMGTKLTESPKKGVKNGGNGDLLSSIPSEGFCDAPAHRSSIFCSNVKKAKKRKKSGTSSKCRADPSTSHPVLRFSKQAQSVMPFLGEYTPRTVLSWLIENGVVKPKQRVRYLRKRDGQVLKEGYITNEGIECNCCNKVHSISNFESHAGSSNRRPSANIFLQDGRSLLECQRQLLERDKPKDFLHKRIKSDDSIYPSDAICSICQDGGVLVLCDYCPSSFHLECVGLEGVPDGKWFCPSCKCSKCGISEFNSDLEKFTPDTKLFCDQCECEYHVRCVQESGSPSLTRCPEGYWFCSKTCSEIFWHLRKLVGVSNSTVLGDFSWTILRAKRENDLDFGTFDKEARTEVHSKLRIVLDVFHECFVTIIEPRTKTDLVADLLYNKESELNRLNFWGFYVMILEKGDEVISVATFRVYGDKVAEVPLVGTRVQYRRKGMCRRLMNELEKLLTSLGVERLLLPAIPEHLETWTKAFGFTVMSQSDKLMLSKYTFLSFQGTTMCQKFLKYSQKALEELTGNIDHVKEKVEGQESSDMEIDCDDDSRALEVPALIPSFGLPSVVAAEC